MGARGTGQKSAGLVLRRSGKIETGGRLPNPPLRGIRWTMRRSLIEWLAISAASLFLGTTALLAFSSHSSWRAAPFELANVQWGGRVYGLVRDGRASLFNQIDFNSSGSPKPLVVNPRAFVFPKATANHQFSVPGSLSNSAGLRQGRRSGRWNSAGHSRYSVHRRRALLPAVAARPFAR